MSDVMAINEPVAWKVSYLSPGTVKITGVKPVPVESLSASKEEAMAYKKEMQASGMVATVTPVFLSPQKRGKMRAKLQTSIA